MSDDQIFRLILILGFVVVCPIGVVHRLRSQATKEKLDRRQEGLFILLTLRPVALVRILSVVAYVIDPTWMAWSAVGLPVWLRWVGVGLGVIGAALLIAVFRFLGTNLTDTVVTRARHTLVTDGPYRWVRHPFYSAMALVVTADSLVTANWFLAATGVATFTLIAIRTRTEERKLLERFGDQYHDFMARTWRFFPRWKR